MEGRLGMFKLAIEAGMSPEELEMLEKEVAESRKGDSEEAEEAPKSKKKPAAKAAKKKAPGKMMSFDEDKDKDDVF